MKDHRFLLASLAIHGCLFAALTSMAVSSSKNAPPKVETAVQRAQVAETLHKTSESALKKQASKLDTMKELMEEASGIKLPEKKDQAVPLDPLAQAEQLAAAIEEMAKRDKAKELARLLKIPEKEARKKIDAEQPKPPPGPPETPEQKMQRLVEQSKQALKDKQERLASRQEGVAVKPDGQGKADGANGGDGAGGKDGGQGAGKGTGQGGTGKGKSGNGDGEGGGGSGYGAGWAITAFLNDQLPLPERTSGNLSQAYSPGGISWSEIPDAGTRVLHQSTGMSIGADGDFANRLYINRWHVIGPFEGARWRDYPAAPVYPPEKAIVLDGVYRGKNNRLVSWELHENAAYPLSPRRHVEDSVYYGYTEIRVDRAQEIWALIGADDLVKVWLNDVLVYDGGTPAKDWFFMKAFGPEQPKLIKEWKLNETRRLLPFKQGVNTVVFKLANGPNHCFFSMVLLPPAGAARR